jgi:hypothetical protein
VIKEYVQIALKYNNHIVRTVWYHENSAGDPERLTPMPWAVTGEYQVYSARVPREKETYSADPGE